MRWSNPFFSAFTKSRLYDTLPTSIKSPMLPRAIEANRAITSSALIAFSSRRAFIDDFTITFNNNRGPCASGCLNPTIRAASVAFQHFRYSSMNACRLLVNPTVPPLHSHSSCLPQALHLAILANFANQIITCYLLLFLTARFYFSQD